MCAPAQRVGEGHLHHDSASVWGWPCQTVSYSSMVMTQYRPHRDLLGRAGPWRHDEPDRGSDSQPTS